MNGGITLVSSGGSCWPPLLLLALQAMLGSSAPPVTWSPSSQELQSLQDLLERLKEKFSLGERGSLELGAFDSDGTGPPTEDSVDLDLVDLEPLPPHLLLSQGPLQQAEVEAQWRRFLASPKRRRHFSGCFGTRLERIGSRTGLGCNFFKARSRRKPRS